MVFERIPEPEVMDDDEEAVAYETADFRRVNRAVARQVASRVTSQRGHALDLGTGPAEIPVFFCEIQPGWRVTAVDASRAMLTLARKKVRDAGLEDRISLLRGDVKNLRALDRPFDAVFSNSLLHHLGDPVAFWREVRRLTKPGGQIVVKDLRRPASRAKARELERRHTAGDSKILRQLFYQSLLAAFTPAEVRAQIAEAGLDLDVRVTTDRHLLVTGTA